MEWPIQEVARLTGTTSRTLRHYDDIGLLPPARVGHNGYRYYDQSSLVRLQRILLLRQLGLGLPQIAEVLTRQVSEPSALAEHLAWLRQEQERLGRQIVAVESTINALTGKETLMAKNMFDGFDHTQYRDEVEERWGKNAYTSSDKWWRGMSEQERGDWKAVVADLSTAWVTVAESGVSSTSPEAQDVAARHIAWLAGVPGTPAAVPGGDIKGYVMGLAQMYVDDPRFGKNYATSEGGQAGAEFVRDALVAYAEANL